MRTIAYPHTGLLQSVETWRHPGTFLSTGTTKALALLKEEISKIKDVASGQGKCHTPPLRLATEVYTE
jgi:hypothetical protein